MTAQVLLEKQIFQIANDISSPERRAEYLEQVCGEDRELYQRVQRLLQMHSEAPEFLERKATPQPTITTAWKTVQTPQEIGPYRIRERLAEGGMGVVYVAQQTQPVRRKVALKLIKPEAASPQTVARFEAERQALAMMDHPNIARVFDGGQTDEGQPYFVMELVQGVPITEYCDESKLTTRERLELVRDVCLAVQHAHRKGIIHRDLKPSNILVAEIDGKPVAKVIDFGVAKATTQPLTDGTVYTQRSQMIGTPLYMSPEQASIGVLDVDTRSDVYSLGVVLYELLAGSPPFDRETFQKATFDEIRRIVREDVPRRPSHLLSTLDAKALTTRADRRRVDERRLRRELHGELDWLTLKALEKDRSRRYQSAAEFADDLQHYLDGQAVAACPPSWAYRTRTFARRHRGLLAGSAVALVLLLGGIATTSWQLLRALDAEEAASRQATLADQAAREAEAESQVARAVNEFVNDDLLGRANPTKELQGDVTVRDLLDRASLSIDERFVDQPTVRAALRETLGRAYLELGKADKAAAALRQSYETRRKLLGDDHRDTLRSGQHLANAIGMQGFPKKAEVLAKKLLSSSAQRWGADDETTLRLQTVLSSKLADQARWDESRQQLQEAYFRAAKHLGPKHELTLTLEGNLLATKFQAQPSTENLEKLMAFVPVISEALGATHLKTLSTLKNVATSHYKMGEYVQAQRVYESLLSTYEKIGGRDYPAYQSTELNLVHCLRELGDAATAVERAEALMERQQKRYAPGHPALLATANELAQCLLANRRETEAEQLLVHHLKAVDSSPFEVRGLRSDLEMMYARVLHQQERFEEAIQAYDAALGSVPHDDQRRRALVASNQGVAYAKIGEWTAAESGFREALRYYRKSLPPDHPDTLACMTNISAAVQSQGRLEEASQMQKEIARLQGKSAFTQDNNDAYERNLRQRLKDTELLDQEKMTILKNLGSLMNKQDRFAEAEQAYREAIKLYEHLELDRGELEIELRINYWFTVWNQKRYADSHTIGELAFARAKKVLPSEHGYLKVARHNLAAANSSFGWKLATNPKATQQDAQRAVQLLSKSVELHPEWVNHWSNLGVACNRAGEFEKAVNAFKKSDQLRGRPDWEHRTFYAQALESLQKHDQARERYEEGLFWVLAKRKNSAQHQRFLREAETRLEIQTDDRESFLTNFFSQAEFEDGWQWRFAGDWLKDHGQYQRAIDTYTAALKNPGNNDVSRIPQDRGYCYLQLEQFERAIADCSSVIETHPDSVFARGVRALAYAGQNKTALALDELKTAAALKPEGTWIWSRWGEVVRQHYRQLQYQGVEREWEHTAAINPQLPMAWFFTSSWLLLADRSEDYHAMVQGVVQESMDLRGCQLAWVAMLCALDPVAVEDGDQQRLRLELAARAAAEGPDWCRKHVAMVRIRCGQIEQGLATLQGIAATEETDDGRAMLAAYLGVAHLAHGDRAAAEKAKKTATTLDLKSIDTLSIQIELEVLLYELDVKLRSQANAIEAESTNA